jgi:hypothetical protein
MMRDASGLSAAQGLGMSDLWRVYVDEAGDRGISDASSGHFVVAAVIVRDQHDGTARRQLADLRAALGRHDHHVLHFHASEGTLNWLSTL